MQESTSQLDEKTRLKWGRIMAKGITATIRDQPEMFLRRVRRGIPEDYRYAIF